MSKIQEEESKLEQHSMVRESQQFDIYGNDFANDNARVGLSMLEMQIIEENVDIFHSFSRS